MSEQRFYTVTEAAAEVGLSPGRLRYYLRQGVLDAVRPNREAGRRDYKISARELHKFRQRPRPNGRPPSKLGPRKQPRVGVRCDRCGRVLHNPENRTLCWRCGPGGPAETARTRRADRRASGLCPECGQPVPTGGSWCLACREAKRRRTVAA